jgi:hypothetical protein
MAWRLSLGVAAASSSLLGCSSLALLEAGGAYGVDRASQSSAVVDGTFGMGSTHELGGEGPALTARAKLGPDVAAMELGLAGYFVAGPRWVEPPFRGRVMEVGTTIPRVVFFGLLGASVLQIESIAGRSSVGALSPSGKLGLSLRARGATSGVTLSVGGEYDVTTDAPKTGYAMLLVGWGSVVYGNQSLVLGAD